MPRCARCRSLTWIRNSGCFRGRRRRPTHRPGRPPCSGTGSRTRLDRSPTPGIATQAPPPTRATGALARKIDWSRDPSGWQADSPRRGAAARRCTPRRRGRGAADRRATPGPGPGGGHGGGARSGADHDVAVTVLGDPPAPGRARRRANPVCELDDAQADSRRAPARDRDVQTRRRAHRARAQGDACGAATTSDPRRPGNHFVGRGDAEGDRLSGGTIERARM